MRKILALGLAIAGLFMTAEAIAEPTGPPCPDLPPIGTQYQCGFLQAGKEIVVNGIRFRVSTDGQGCFVVIGHNHNPCEAILAPTCFIAKSDDGELGTVTINLAPGSAPTTLRGNAGTNRLLPANLQINLNVTVTVSSLPGTFRGSLTLTTSGIEELPLSNVALDAQTTILTNEEGESLELTSESVVLNP